MYLKRVLIPRVERQDDRDDIVPVIKEYVRENRAHRQVTSDEI